MLKEDWEALAKRLDYNDEYAMFFDLYITQGISVIKLGERLGFTRGTIARRIGLLGIEKRSRGGANSLHPQQFRLWRLDQRLLFSFSRSVIAAVARVSQATLQTYIGACTKGVNDVDLHL